MNTPEVILEEVVSQLGQPVVEDSEEIRAKLHEAKDILMSRYPGQFDILLDFEYKTHDGDWYALTVAVEVPEGPVYYCPEFIRDEKIEHVVSALALLCMYCKNYKTLDENATWRNRLNYNMSHQLIGMNELAKIGKFKWQKGAMTQKLIKGSKQMTPFEISDAVEKLHNNPNVASVGMIPIDELVDRGMYRLYDTAQGDIGFWDEEMQSFAVTTWKLFRKPHSEKEYVPHYDNFGEAIPVKLLDTFEEYSKDGEDDE